MPIPRFQARHVHNEMADPSRPYGEEERRVLSLAAHRRARDEIGSWPGYAPTPLVMLDALASSLRVASVAYKDEGERFGLGSFKALGGAYAVLCALRDRSAAAHTEIGSGLASSPVGLPGITVAAATDGNHGRSVAWGARLFGCKCIIYLHEHVSMEREREIAKFGAEIVRGPGQYDESVRRCAADAAERNWVLVADTSDDPAAAVPALVMQGYTLIAQEILDAAGGTLPTHVFVQAGVGGLAAALAAHFWETLGPDRPRLVVVEPERADCVFRAVASGRPVPIEGDTDTFMACLAAGEVSAPAWVVLRTSIDDVLALPDSAAVETMRFLADPLDGDPPLVAGESGCAAMAGLLAAAADERLRTALHLDDRSRVVVIGSESDTDAETYQRVVGRNSDAVRQGRRTPKREMAR
jgi:diaminopropionate ammonia-lyase